MKSTHGVAVAACAAIAALAVLLGGAGAAAVGEPTPSATSGAPITVVIPEASPSSTPSSTPRPSSTLPTLPFEDPEQPVAGACTPGQANDDGSPIPASRPRDGAEELELSEERITADEWIIATAPGFLAGELGQVAIYRGPTVVGSYTVGDDGEFSARFRIPVETSPGTHVIEVTGWKSGCVANAEFTVVTAPSNANWLSLWWVWIVLGALLLGMISLLVAFRADIARWFARTPAGSTA